MKKLYAIYDIVAEVLLDHIMIQRADAAAIRTFDDILRAKTPNGINEHPADFNLIQLGTLMEHGGEGEQVEIIPQYKVVLEGTSWLAMKQKEDRQPDEC